MFSAALSKQLDPLDQVLVQDPGITVRLPECLAQVLFRGADAQVLFRRQSWQNLLDAIEPTIELFETVFHFGWSEHVGSLNNRFNPASRRILASSSEATQVPRRENRT